MQNRKMGFTLVELSIVLVIIGLLIGGILVGQSMMSAARISQQAKQLQQFDTMVSNFQTKFNGLPGDSSIMGCNSTRTGRNGTACDNGLIETQASQGLGDNWYGSYTETGWVWQDLYNAGLLTISYPQNYYTVGVAAGVNIPAAIMGLKGTVIAAGAILPANGYGNQGNDWNSTNVGANYWVLCLNNTATGNNMSFCPGNSTANSLTPAEALALDKKLDDGMPMTGTIQANGSGWAAPTNGASGCLTAAYNTPGTSYNVNNTSAACGLRILMLSISQGAQ